ncbi:MAG: flagellar motor switch protein FliN [bacterium]
MEEAVLKSEDFTKEGGGPKIHPVQFAKIEETPPQHTEEEINLLMDIPVEVSVELGRTKKLVKDLLGIKEGGIIKIDKAAGEPVDIMANGQLIAKGMVVTEGDNLGVRVTEIVELSSKKLR